MKKPRIEIIKNGSINGKIVLLAITAIILLIYIAGFWVAAIKSGLKDYGHQLLEFYGLSASLFWLKQIGKPGVTAVAGAIVNKINGKTKVVKEEEGDA